jgi:hypothetical protein
MKFILLALELHVIYAVFIFSSFSLRAGSYQGAANRPGCLPARSLSRRGHDSMNIPMAELVLNFSLTLLFLTVELQIWLIIRKVNQLIRIQTS